MTRRRATARVRSTGARTDVLGRAVPRVHRADGPKYRYIYGKTPQALAETLGLKNAYSPKHGPTNQRKRGKTPFTDGCGPRRLWLNLAPTMEPMGKIHPIENQAHSKRSGRLLHGPRTGRIERPASTSGSGVLVAHPLALRRCGPLSPVPRPSVRPRAAA
jgi:hypothetical protein